MNLAGLRADTMLAQVMTEEDKQAANKAWEKFLATLVENESRETPAK